MTTKVIEVNSWQIKFNNWKGKRVYVTIPNKHQGSADVGYYDIQRDAFEEKKFKGMISWGNINVCENFENWLIEQCKSFIA